MRNLFSFTLTFTVFDQLPVIVSAGRLCRRDGLSGLGGVSAWARSPPLVINAALPSAKRDISETGSYWAYRMAGPSYWAYGTLAFCKVVSHVLVVCVVLP